MVTAKLAQPSIDGLFARWDSGIADARVFGEYAFVVVANGPDMHAVAVTFEEHSISLADAQEPANFDGYGDLPFTRDFGLLLHARLGFLTLAWIPYPDNGCRSSVVGQFERHALLAAKIAADFAGYGAAKQFAEKVAEGANKGSSGAEARIHFQRLNGTSGTRALPGP